ncbi:MAG: hemerythrin domain-containing protein, partial [Breznakibacter sp.]|nr:hemerythrin domain-containing protein [Breznakibacter sp.]
MSQLIQYLKSEHHALVEILKRVQVIGPSQSESKQLLLEAKRALLAHLKKEDLELYPKLKEAAKQNEEIDRKVNNFGKDMEEITKFTLQFFDKMENNQYSPIEYAKDFGKLVTILS